MHRWPTWFLSACAVCHPQRQRPNAHRLAAARGPPSGLPTPQPPQPPSLTPPLQASLGEGQGAAKALAALLVLLQAAAAGLAYPTWHSFGWRMWSRMPGDLRRTDAAECRRALCKRDLFAALAKLDMQVRCAVPLLRMLWPARCFEEGGV